MSNPPPQPYQPPVPQPTESRQPETCPLATVSLVLGICAFFTWIITGIPAVICGHMAKSKIKKSGGALTGSGKATAGLICGYVSFGMIFVIAFLSALATPVIMKQKRKAEQVQTTSAAKQIFLHLIEYDDDYGQFPESLEALAAANKSIDLDELQPHRGEWIYHGDTLSNSDNSGAFLLSWQQQHTDKWVILRIDGSVQVLQDASYQAALRSQNAP
ncbi:DUF4190 domain-containing protein [Verrucomicrobiaceae bacterium R5-34]|uniref:DUF4190 domain-containing protein n=1 Tax=Oceaniferula flava TaxID=2800421 RepID=A0AAE2SGK5_9BACT|nr:DUF4190 domain-containing protein [Oceaniferula flavus]MBK1830753.1 DUF4190 domain-containing protein [Verrucomicrobiaceae bacterium R5-34]MBK1856011.1 DUF4190 domain-containing protein [Oceaniferula flavus]MBM1137318.1 DUF4190 domain-containing protein [Oceaniferula flavus]